MSVVSNRVTVLSVVITKGSEGKGFTTRLIPMCLKLKLEGVFELPQIFLQLMFSPLKVFSVVFEKIPSIFEFFFLCFE
jgi:hypothetical protein